MEYARLGLTGLSVSRIGFGCAAMGGYDYGRVDDAVSCRAVYRALDLGINFFDTADVYGLGHAEEVLARALGPRRSEVVIATKFGVKWDAQGRTSRDLSPRRVREALEQSLRRLRLDCITLYQIHWPDDRTPLEETIGALVACQKAGKVRHLGCCNFSGGLVETAQRVARLESLQLPFSLAERTWADTMRNCVDKFQMAALAYSPLAQGLFSGKYGPGSKFEGTDLRSRSALFQGEALKANLAILERLKTVARCLNRTSAQVALRWILDQPFVTSVLAGAKTPDQVEENAGALGWTLSLEDRAFLEAGLAGAEAAGVGTVGSA